MADYTVLIPLDGSALAEHSLSYLHALANLGTVHVHLVGAVDEAHDAHVLSSGESSERERNAMAAYLRGISDEISKHLGMSTEVEVKSGIPAEVILARAAALNPDLIVISTHGRSGIARWRRGSVADKVIRGTESSVLVVGPKTILQGSWLQDEAVPTFNAVLVPLDGSALSEQALPLATSIATKCQSAVHLVRSVSVPVSDTSGLDYDTDGQVILQLEDAANAYLSEIAAKIKGTAGVMTKAYIGTTERVLEDYISAQSIDLVVMTSHGRSGLVRAALGSVTDRLLGNGAAPVLVVRAGEQAS